MHHPTDRITHTTAFDKPVMEHWLEWEIAQWVHHEGSIRRPIVPWANALTTELQVAPRIEYISYWVSIKDISINVGIFKSVLSQSIDQFNGHVKYYFKIYTFDFSLNLSLYNHLHNCHVSLCKCFIKFKKKMKINILNIFR